jgi:hypothetical protein
MANTHARTKEKRKKLKLKAFFKKVYEKRIQKLKAFKDKEMMSKQAPLRRGDEALSFESTYVPYRESWVYRRNRLPIPKQNKRRKLERQTGRKLKK